MVVEKERVTERERGGGKFYDTLGWNLFNRVALLMRVSFKIYTNKMHNGGVSMLETAN